MIAYIVGGKIPHTLKSLSNLMNGRRPGWDSSIDAETTEEFLGRYLKKANDAVTLGPAWEGGIPQPDGPLRETDMAGAAVSNLYQLNDGELLELSYARIPNYMLRILVLAPTTGVTEKQRLEQSTMTFRHEGQCLRVYLVDWLVPL